MSSGSDSFQRLTPEEVQAVLESGKDVFVVDVREPRQFHAGHLPEAILLPAGDFADRYARELDAEDTVIIVCEKGMTSEAAAKFLLQQGFTDVATMTGGMNAWSGPLVSGG